MTATPLRVDKHVMDPLPAGQAYQSPDGAVPVTPDRIKHWIEQFRKMKAAGLRIPTPVDHRDNVEAIYVDQDAPWGAGDNAGWVDDLGIGEDGKFYAKMSVEDRQVAGKVGKTIKEVSPWIKSEFRDGKGRIWKDVFTHLAHVLHPVAPGQQNYKPITDGKGMNFKFSLDGPSAQRGIEPSAGCFRFSLSPFTKGATMSADPNPALTQGADNQSAFFAVYGPDGKQCGNVDKASGKFMAMSEQNAAAEAATAVSPTVPPSAAETLDGPPKKMSKHAKALAKFSAIMALLDEDDEEDAVADVPAPAPVEMAVEDTPAAEATAAEDADSVSDEVPVPPEAVEPAAAPKNPNQPPKPKEGEIVKEEQPNMMMSLQGRIGHLEKELATERKAKFAARVETLVATRRITPPIAAKLKEELGKTDVRMSLAGNASVHTKIAAYEELPEGHAFPAAGAMQEQPFDSGSAMPPYGTPEYEAAVGKYFAGK